MGLIEYKLKSLAEVGCFFVPKKNGDIRLVLYDHDTMPPRDEVACFLWFHTGFVTTRSTVFEKEEIDMAWSDRRCKVFNSDFRIELIFEDVPNPNSTLFAASMKQLPGVSNHRQNARDSNHGVETPPSFESYHGGAGEESGGL